MSAGEDAGGIPGTERGYGRTRAGWWSVNGRRLLDGVRWMVGVSAGGDDGGDRRMGEGH